MQANNESLDTNEIIKRPFGVWFLTIYAGILKGLIPFAFMFLVFLRGDSLGAELLPPLAVIGNLALGVGTIWSAIAAWRGSNKGRIIFLVFVALVYGLVACNNYQVLASSYIPDSLKPAAIARVIRGVLFPVFYIWYFTRQKTLIFYKSIESPASNAE